MADCILCGFHPLSPAGRPSFFSDDHPSCWSPSLPKTFSPRVEDLFLFCRLILSITRDTSLFIRRIVPFSFRGHSSRTPAVSATEALPFHVMSSSISFRPVLAGEAAFPPCRVFFYKPPPPFFPRLSRNVAFLQPVSNPLPFPFSRSCPPPSFVYSVSRDRNGDSFF